MLTGRRTASSEDALTLLRVAHNGKHFLVEAFLK